MPRTINDPDRAPDPATLPVFVPDEEANGPEQPPARGWTLAPAPPDEAENFRAARQDDECCRVTAGELQDFVTRLFEATGLSARHAQLCAETFVLQEMRGVHHHGLARLPATLEALESGTLNPSPRQRILHDSGAMLLLDADRAPGMIACHDAMSRAMAKADGAGIGMAVVRNSSHFLAAAPYCIRAANRGYIGIAFSNSPASMAYPGAKGAVLGNGPFGFAAPTDAGFPIVFDSAMTVSGGRLIEMAQGGETLPAALAGLDENGNPTTDPTAILDGGSTQPIGLHKGAGLVLLFEILTGLLGGGAFLYGETPELTSETQCCIAVRTDRFMPADQFLGRMTAYVRGIANEARSTGGEALLPGERAQHALETSLANSLEIDAAARQELRVWAQRLDVDAPF
ncbi:MAG TPA: Ldh family oxidoreductase [Dehalococcoidia bacterium]|nr:Ldh family oxidoreductase [Dehalococcoidia bacterium]